MRQVFACLKNPCGFSNIVNLGIFPLPSDFFQTYSSHTGVYWRYFIWFDNHNPEVEPQRLNDIGSWCMPPPLAPLLTSWQEDEVFEFAEIPGKKFVTNQMFNNMYIWSIKPKLEESRLSGVSCDVQISQRDK